MVGADPDNADRFGLCWTLQLYGVDSSGCLACYVAGFAHVFGFDVCDIILLLKQLCSYLLQILCCCYILQLGHCSVLVADCCL